MSVRIDNAADGLSRAKTGHEGTYSCMIYRVTDTAADDAIIYMYDSAGPTTRHYIGLDTSDRLSYYNGTNVVSGSTITLATWYHLAMVVSSGGQATIYLNGVLDITGNGTNTNAITNIQLGDAGSELFNGRLAAVKFWTVALTAAELLNEMRCIRPVKFASVDSWYPFFDSTTDGIRDYSGNAKTWTVVGSLTSEDGPPIPWGSDAREVVTTTLTGGGGGGGATYKLLMVGVGAALLSSPELLSRREAFKRSGFWGVFSKLFALSAALWGWRA